MKKKIESILKESIAVKEQLIKTQLDNIQAAAEKIIASLEKGGKLIIFGNGGSAADAQHIAAEMVGRFKVERRPLASIALTTNTSTLTAIANDYGYEEIFRRQIEALGDDCDVVMGISTSGNAKNVLNAVEYANKRGIFTIALTGAGGAKLAKIAKLSIIVPSSVTARIQESHIAIGHIICQLVEESCIQK